MNGIDADLRVLGLAVPDAPAQSLDLRDDHRLRRPRARSSSDSTPATCFRCCSRMARWNQSSIGGAMTPASARMRRSPGSRR